MIGILALQGDVREHARAFADLGVDTSEVRRRGDLQGLDGIVLPGGESTTLSLLLESTGLFDPLERELNAGLPVLGTCAGLVLLATRVEDGRPDQRTFGVIDCTVRRNGYGRQRYSFETMLHRSSSGTPPPTAPDGVGAPWSEGGELPAIFIRAPRVVSVGPDVQVLARLARLSVRNWSGQDSSALSGPETEEHGGDLRGDGSAGGDPALCRQGNALGSAFHPELTNSRDVHRLFARMAGVKGAGL